MEGLPHDFGIEDDSDDESSIEKNKTKDKSKERLLERPDKSKESIFEEKETAEPPKQERLEHLERIEDADNAPELDAEAPLEHLSRVESEAIAQTMASERLSEIKEEDVGEITSENLAARSFLEDVEATGDIDLAYNQTLSELGDAAIESTSEVVEVASETAIPVDPESLVQDAQNELRPNVYYPIAKRETAETTDVDKPKADNSGDREVRYYPAPRQTHRSERVFDGVIDYLVGRRVGRTASEVHQEEVTKKLTSEVRELRLELTSRESHVRQLAKNRSLEKLPKKEEKKVEDIGKLVVKNQEPESAKKQAEIAGISAHTMERARLLRVAEAIKIEGLSLKELYVSHRIGEKALRRVTAEYLRGGDYKKVLQRELLEREKDFERDPKLRDQGDTQPIDSKKVDLNDLLQKTGIDWSEPQPTLTEPNKIKGANLPALIEDFKSSSSPVRRLIDIIMVGVILLMAVIIVILIIKR